MWDGSGIFLSADGTIYEGEFVCGVRHGKGKQTLVPNDHRGRGSVPGEFIAGLSGLDAAVGGLSTLYRPVSYDGEWVDGCWDGQGAVQFCNGDIVQGKFQPSPTGGGFPAGVVKHIFASSKQGSGKRTRERKALHDRLGNRVEWIETESRDSGLGFEHLKVSY